MAVFLTIILVLALLLLLFFYILFDMAFAPKRKHTSISRRIPNDDQYGPIRDRMLSNIDKLEALEFEAVTTKSHDGLTLYGRYYKRERENIVEIDFHGYRGHAMRDYCGGCFISKQNGISSIIVDQRSHGNSEGNAITFGIKERYDVVSWIEFALSRFGSDTRIILSGVSMGAATVLMASELNLPENVVCILADCPYSSPSEIIKKVAKDRGFSAKVIYPFIKLSARLFARINLEESSPIEAVKNTDIPVLIVHGDDDRYVPYEMGKAVFDACLSHTKKMLTVKRAGHAISYFLDTENYTKTVSDFVEDAINEKTA
ncbi:MAG: alpha/beta hydrolase [Clostridia bacterium]|nr:alpha/beta hydrolase [Clostridia bacterium]